MTYIADKRIYVSRLTDKVVPEDHPDPKFLLCPEGGELTDDVAEAYGLKARKSALSDKEQSAGSKNK